MSTIFVRAATALIFVAFTVNANASDFLGFGHNYLKPDGSPRTVAVFLYDGMTTQDFVGVYSMLNFSAGADLKIDFVGLKRGLVHDERGRLSVMANKSIDEISQADIFIVPGGNMFPLMNNKKILRWIKSMYDSSEYAVSICTGAILLAKAGAITGKHAGTAWAARDFLAPFGVTYVATPPPVVEGKYYSAAGAAGGIEIGLMLMERITGSPRLSRTMEFMSEWNPHMLYGSGDPKSAKSEVLNDFEVWKKTDPFLKLAP